MRKRAPRAGREVDPLDELGAAVAAALGGPPPAEVLERFSRYLDLLAKWNRVHRLVGPRSTAAIVRDLFIDSLAFLRVLPGGPISIVDLGTGVGIPGIPIKLVRPEVDLTLVEPRRKCVSFLGEVKRSLGLLDVRIMEGRAEDLLKASPGESETRDVAISRALGAVILGPARDWVKPGGTVILSGPPPGTRPVDPGSGLEEEVVVGPRGRRAFLIARRD